jgi:hypothetical protein
MKITICGSMVFAQKMLEIMDKLEKIGHEVFIPSDTLECVRNPKLNESLEHCYNFNNSGKDIDKDHFDLIDSSEAILVLNYSKNGINNYVGGATLMEIAVARHLDRKIFLLNEPPSEEDLKYALEIKLARPIVLKGDLNKIN